jgi:hypothetical protein
MTTKEELAARLTGRTIGEETSWAEGTEAREAGLVIVFGASDDLMEFEGAIDDEVDVQNGGMAQLDQSGVLDRDRCEDDDEIADHVQRLRTAKTIKALWAAEPGYSWTYETDIPHATFEIVEDGVDGEPYCRGIVFELGAL